MLTAEQVKEELENDTDFLKPYSVKANGDVSAAVS